jgi:hypothetical protein
MMHHLLNKVEEIELLRSGGDGEREHHQEGDHKLHPCQLAISCDKVSCVAAATDSTN